MVLFTLASKRRLMDIGIIKAPGHRAPRVTDTRRISSDIGFLAYQKGFHLESLNKF